MAVDQKVWFITGVSRGFGKVLTEHALANSDIVIGTTRDGKARKDQFKDGDVILARSPKATVHPSCDFGGEDLAERVAPCGFGR